MHELDDVVRQNQLACLPFAKSGRVEAELFEAHPELFDLIERGRRAKIDSFHLQSRLRDEDVYYANAAKIRSKSIPQNDDHASPSATRARRKSAQTRDDESIALGQKTSTIDLMFEMEEDHDKEPGEESSPGESLVNRDRLHPTLAPEALSHRKETEEAPLNYEERILANSGVGISPRYHELTTSSTDAQSPVRRWAPSVLDSSKLNMKEIMAQTSSNRLSSLSSGLAIRAPSGESTTSSSSSKLSQRERKRQQQQRQVEQQEPPSISEPLEEVEEIVKPVSPWQVAPASPKVSLRDVLSPAAAKSPTPSTEKSRRQASTPPLTLRQTISGNTPAARRSISGGPLQQQTPPKSMRSASTPSVATKSPQSPPTAGRNESPSISSVRYQPPLAEPSLQLSMADIFSQQQTEKDVIKEAVAKRSLQEIQEEQAFQEWWDQESKKVQDEAEEAATRGKTVGPRGGKVGAREGRPRSSRGNSRGRGRGRGREESSDAAWSRGETLRDPKSPERRKTSRGRGYADGGRGRSTRT